MVGKDKRNYETFVFDTIMKELKSEKLGLIPSACKMFKGKGYYSKDRDAKIKIDVSIEVFYSDEKQFSFLVAIECKEYSNPISVNEIEEFYAKVRQISGLNVKAIFVTNSSLQKGALQYARSKKIAVIRLYRFGQVSWISYFGKGGGYSISRKKLERGLFTQNYQPTNRDFFACNDKRMFDSWDRLLRYYLSQ